jgi:hypothetical protein
MNKELFKKIVCDIRAYDDCFVLKANCTGMVGFLSYKKYTAAIRIIAYGTPGDAKDEYYALATHCH